LSSFAQINIENIELKKQPAPAIAKWLRYPKEHKNFDYDVIDYLVDYK
jgi:Tfp pilus assembly PilM family ATPase